MSVQLTITSSMAARDFSESLDRHLALGLRLLDLRDCIFGKNVTELTPDEANRAAALISQRRMSVHSLSTQIMYADVELGEAHFRRHLQQLDHVISLARVLHPKVIRIASASTRQRAMLPNSMPYLQKNTPWIVETYRDACDRIKAAGFIAAIQNEAAGSIFSTPAETMEFFKLLNRPAARLVWDIGNLWQLKTYPSLEAYLILRPILAAVLLKGGMSQNPLGPLAWKAALADTSWPVLPIVKRIVSDAAILALGLVPPQGQPKPAYDYKDLLERDLAFLRSNVPGLA